MWLHHTSSSPPSRRRNHRPSHRTCGYPRRYSGEPAMWRSGLTILIPAPALDGAVRPHSAGVGKPWRRTGHLAWLDPWATAPRSLNARCQYSPQQAAVPSSLTPQVCRGARPRRTGPLARVYTTKVNAPASDGAHARLLCAADDTNRPSEVWVRKNWQCLPSRRRCQASLTPQVTPLPALTEVNRQTLEARLGH